MPIILAVDAGNTRVKFGVFESQAARVPQVLAVTAIRLGDGINRSQGADSPVASLPENGTPDSVVSGGENTAAASGWAQVQAESLAERLAAWLNEQGVVPDVHMLSGSNPPVRNLLLQHWPLSAGSVRVIDRHHQLPVTLDVHQPETVGIDRLLTSLAARQLCGGEHPLVVVDAGTATTINLTTSDGVFRGGAILPGLRLSAHAMHDYTARLPLIDADQLFPASQERPDAPLPGRSTVDAMKAGLFWGQVGGVRTIAGQLLQAAADQYEDTRPGVVVMTGGGGRQMVSEIGGALYVDCLTLHGLAALADSTHAS